MIDRDYDDYYLVCDNCGRQVDEPFDSWEKAVEAKKENGYTSKKYGNGWKDLCPECK